MADEPSGATPTTTPTATVTVPAAPVAPQQAVPQAGATPTSPTPDTAARIHDLETQLNSANARIRELNTESKNHRLKAESLQAVSETLTQLGIKPEDLKATIEAGTAAQQKAAALEQEKVLGDAAGVLKLQGNALFKSLLKDVPLKIEGDGEARKVLVTAADGRAVDFEEYAKTRPELMDALPMLQANGQQQNGATGGTRWAGGSASGGTPQPNKYEAIRQEVKAKTEQQKPEQRDLTRAGIH